MKTSLRTKIGIVKSLIGTQTAVIEVVELKRHPKYHKGYQTAKRFHAQVGKSVPAVGQRVTIAETRPRSALKRWFIVGAQS
jgi:small subunit ribosomal protein S17